MDRVKSGYQAKFRNILKRINYPREYIEDQVIIYRTQINKLHSKEDIVEFDKEYIKQIIEKHNKSLEEMGTDILTTTQGATREQGTMEEMEDYPIEEELITPYVSKIQASYREHLKKKQRKNAEIIQKFMKSRMSQHLIEKQRQIKEYGKYMGTIRKPVKEEDIQKLKFMSSPEHKKALLELQISNMASYTNKRMTDALNFKRKLNSIEQALIDVITGNQIERVKIIKEEESLFNEINKQHSEGLIIPIEQLETLPKNNF